MRVVCQILQNLYTNNNIEEFEGIANQLGKTGLKAKTVYNCFNCGEKHKLNSMEIWLKTFDEDNWHISVPEISQNKNANKDILITTAFEYGLVLNFFNVPDNIDNLTDYFDRLYNTEFCKRESNFFSDKNPIDFHTVKDLSVMKAINLIKEHTGYGKGDTDNIFNRFISYFANEYKVLSYKGLNGEDYIYNTGFIKTQIDMAICKVLGLNIIYDKAEVQRNIECIFSADSR